MRILMIRPGPAFSVADVYRGWHRALVGLGCQVVDFNLDERLNFYSLAGQIEHGEFKAFLNQQQAVAMASRTILAACYEFQPDIVFAVSGFFTTTHIWDLIRARGTKVVLLHTESPYEDDRQIVRAAHVTLNLVNDPRNIERYRAVAPTEYAPHAYDPTVHFPAPPTSPDSTADFCFVGTGFPSRVTFFEACDFEGIDVAFAGNWMTSAADSPLRKYVSHRLDTCVDNDVAVDLYRGSKASVNLYRREAENPGLSAGWAMGPREVELAATGTFFLRESRGEGDAVLAMLPTFNDPGQFTDLLRWYLAHDDYRIDLARQARAAVADRTFTANAVAMLSAVDSL
ncbi:MAG: hypothetical protein NVSMB4_00550 [Acidimicrobiales bacterium]